MMDDPNSSYVIAAYGFGLLIILGMILAIWRDYRQLKQKLAAFGGKASGRGFGQDQE
ncbi:heme exporter protein CcmD [Beijerinckia indica]|uniref:Heme exporter protein D n=1 Tax=Beijerinckia indica subsp. indica (strain ATCC 9039 / DSM 1715 / NCIMB 8712) TaxID=395963 RepID=B2IGH8_BEII9|nr:heme exporter protein CcmD [Beijerinckia indica]ACB94360.1 hypothetical protein Bind_0710 [Beijerinckia indica subsp. indica ATCC 9039]